LAVFKLWSWGLFSCNSVGDPNDGSNKDSHEYAHKGDHSLPSTLRKQECVGQQYRRIKYYLLALHANQPKIEISEA
jgi:hypothetical protein